MVAPSVYLMYGQ